jgi:hypothetical protein
VTTGAFRAAPLILSAATAALSVSCVSHKIRYQVDVLNVVQSPGFNVEFTQFDSVPAWPESKGVVCRIAKQHFPSPSSSPLSRPASFAVSRGPNRLPIYKGYPQSQL